MLLRGWQTTLMTSLKLNQGHVNHVYMDALPDAISVGTSVAMMHVKRRVQVKIHNVTK